MTADFLRILFTVLLVMDPIGIVPQFLSVTARYDKPTRNRVILKAVLIAGVVLVVFLLAGKLLLDFFGIMPGAFYISGGILFFLIAFQMIYSKPGNRSIPQEPPLDSARSAGQENEGSPPSPADSHVSTAVFPLAIPLIAGPGLLTVIIMFVTAGPGWLYSVSLLFPAILISLGVAFVVLRCSTLLLNFLGIMGIMIMEKIMGLILAGFAVQFIYNGLVELGITGG
ncbi:MAG: MarC family protein [Treponema sp.]|jgi:multiple antibiotic resistance protein|nr:MarC family protein [Treponema sp.]